MSTLSLKVRYRPVRIGWCIDGGDWDQLRTALRFTHAFAGGRYHPLIPIEPEGDARALVGAFHVDVLYPVSKTPTVTTFVGSYPNLPWPEYDDQLFWPRWEHRPPHAVFVDVYHAAAQIHERRIRDVADPVLHATVFRWQPNDPLADVFLATAGAYPGASDEIPDYERLLVNALHGKVFDLSMDSPVPADLNTALTPSRLTTYDLEADRSPFGRPGVFVGDANDFAAIVDYWNYRAVAGGACPRTGVRLTGTPV
jgi:hypothetical protein